MDRLALRRQHIKWNISQNPLEITIHRIEKVEADGAFADQESILGPFTVRIYEKGNRMPSEISTTAGTKQTDKGWGMLADYTADIKAGPNVEDKFETPIGIFLIHAIYPQVVDGQIAGYQADLEKVM